MVAGRQKNYRLIQAVLVRVLSNRTKNIPPRSRGIITTEVREKI
jgi:hypothetical protein